MTIIQHVQVTESDYEAHPVIKQSISIEGWVLIVLLDKHPAPKYD